jgi:hypothetical protein
MIIIIKMSVLRESILKPHPEDPKWMEVYMPPTVLREKIKRFSMARFSTIKDLFASCSTQCL